MHHNFQSSVHKAISARDVFNCLREVGGKPAAAVFALLLVLAVEALMRNIRLNPKL